MTMLKNISLIILNVLLLISCGEVKKQEVSNNESKEITIYTVQEGIRRKLVLVKTVRKSRTDAQFGLVTIHTQTH